MSAYSDLILGTSGLVGYWRLGEASGSALDAVGSNHGTVSGATYAQTGIPSETGGNTAYAFDGINDTVFIPYNAAINPAGDFTFTAWVYCTGGQGTDRAPVSTRGGTTDNGFNFYARSDNQWEAWWDAGGGTWVGENLGTVSVTLNQWVHLVGVFDASSGQIGVGKLYVNSALSYTTSSFTFERNADDQLAFGAHGNGTSPFPGRIDEVAIYNVALDAATILAHYTAGSTMPEAVAATESALTARWPHRIRDTQTQPVWLTREPAARVLLPRR